ncbi:MAG: FeoA domain-containing protein [Rhodothermales bacterium]
MAGFQASDGQDARPDASQNALTLADVPSGYRAQVDGFVQHIPSNRRAHLQAYGVLPGHWVTVVQQTPVTVVQVDHTELALENDLASDVWVSRVEPSR